MRITSERKYKWNHYGRSVLIGLQSVWMLARSDERIRMTAIYLIAHSDEGGYVTLECEEETFYKKAGTSIGMSPDIVRVTIGEIMKMGLLRYVTADIYPWFTLQLDKTFLNPDTEYVPASQDLKENYIKVYMDAFRELYEDVDNDVFFKYFFQIIQYIHPTKGTACERPTEPNESFISYMTMNDLMERIHVKERDAFSLMECMFTRTFVDRQHKYVYPFAATQRQAMDYRFVTSYPENTIIANPALLGDADANYSEYITPMFDSGEGDDVREQAEMMYGKSIMFEYER